MAELTLTGGHIALIDDEDLPIALTGRGWQAKKNFRTFYATRQTTTGFELLHKLLTGYPMTDHINGNGLDNRRLNLRLTNSSLNQANRIHVARKYGFRGVTLHKKSGKYQAAIVVNQRYRYLGLFDQAEDAARAYDAAAIEAWGTHARPNFSTGAIFTPLKLDSKRGDS